MKSVLPLVAITLLAASSVHAAVVAYTVDNSGTALTNGVLLGSNAANIFAGPSYNGVQVNFLTGAVAPWGAAGSGIFRISYLTNYTFDAEGAPTATANLVSLWGSSVSGQSMGFTTFSSGGTTLARLAEGTSINNVATPVPGYTHFNGSSANAVFLDGEAVGSPAAIVGPLNTGWGNPFEDNKIGFVGMEFQLPDGAHYGYAQFDYDDVSNRLTLMSFGYETTPDTPILAGATVPEPGTAVTGLLSLGLLATRRRRAV